MLKDGMTGFDLFEPTDIDEVLGPRHRVLGRYFVKRSLYVAPLGGGGRHLWASARRTATALAAATLAENTPCGG